MIMIYFLVVLLILFVLYALSTNGRRGQPGFDKFRPYLYAHRGLHGMGVPENSMRAFRRAKEAGYGIELDIHLLKDGDLAVIHDSDLKRTTGQDGIVENRNIYFVFEGKNLFGILTVTGEARNYNSTF